MKVKAEKSNHGRRTIAKVYSDCWRHTTKWCLRLSHVCSFTQHHGRPLRFNVHWLGCKYYYIINALTNTIIGITFGKSVSDKLCLWITISIIEVHHWSYLYYSPTNTRHISKLCQKLSKKLWSESLWLRLIVTLLIIKWHVFLYDNKQ